MAGGVEAKQRTRGMSARVGLNVEEDGRMEVV